MKFAFLFFEFYVPYTVGFWILFGGEKHGKVMGDDGRKNWEKLNDLMFSVWSVSIINNLETLSIRQFDQVQNDT